MTGRDQVSVFIEEAAVNIGFAKLTAGLATGRPAFFVLDWLRCPWCGTGVLVSTIVADLRSGEADAEVYVDSFCDDELAIDDLWRIAEADVLLAGVSG